MNQAAVLTGTSTYNDPSATQPLTTTWSVVSGPGSVTFEKPHSLSTNALFSATGTYVLQLAGTDGILSSSSTVTVTVVPPLPNNPPHVNAGANQTTTVGASLTLNGNVSDDNPQIPLTIQWSQVSGPGIGTVTFGTSEFGQHHRRLQPGRHLRAEPRCDGRHSRVEFDGYGHSQSVHRQPGSRRLGRSEPDRAAKRDRAP